MSLHQLTHRTPPPSAPLSSHPHLRCSLLLSLPVAQTSPDGLSVCLTCFNAGCNGHNQHAQRHFEITRHPVVLRIHKEEVMATANGASSSPLSTDSDARPAKITKLAIGVPGGVQLDQPTFRYVTSVVCLHCNIIVQTQTDADREAEQAEAARRRAEGEQPLPPRAKSPIDALVDAVLLATSASSASAVDQSWAGETPQPCEHTLTLSQSEDPPIIGAKGSATCSQCSLTSNLWLCLTCGELHCGRAYADGSGGNGHAVAHYKATQHPLVVKMGTISAEGTADVFCYACDNTVVDPQLSGHLHTFGLDLATQEVTEKSTAQLEVDANLHHNWSVVLNEAGKEAQLRYGEGFAGMRNLGNRSDTLMHAQERHAKWAGGCGMSLWRELTSLFPFCLCMCCVRAVVTCRVLCRCCSTCPPFTGVTGRRDSATRPSAATDGRLTASCVRCTRWRTASSAASTP